jgi:hypothetical protein
VQVLVTILLIIAIAMWTTAVYSRLARLRKQVKQAWSRLEVDQTNEAIKTVYNKHVNLYNQALEAFPANLIAPMAGFKPARRY